MSESATNKSLLELWIGYLAAKLYLHMPDNAYLRELASEFLETQENISATSEALADYGERLTKLIRSKAYKDDKLVRACGIYGIHNMLEIDLLVFSLLPYYDERFKPILSALHGNQFLRVANVFPILLTDNTPRERVIGILAESRLWRSRLLLNASKTANRFELALEINPILVDYLLVGNGNSPARVEYLDKHQVDTEKLNMIELTPSALETVEEIFDCYREGSCSYIQVLSAGNERLKLVFESLRDRFDGLALFHFFEDSRDEDIIDAELFASVKESLLVIDARHAARMNLPQNWIPNRPVVIFSKSNLVITDPKESPVTVIYSRQVSAGEQKRIWQHYLHDTDIDIEDINILANQTYLNIEQIRQAALIYRTGIESKPKTQKLVEKPAPQHRLAIMSNALGKIAPLPASPYATISRPRINESKLVVRRETQQQLDEIITRVRNRVIVQDEWDMRGISNRGNNLVVMLHGPSGTGKTLATDIIAARLFMPVITVDLSKIVSKYIGETEAQLDKVFDLAEGFRGILFFDEADALFGKRTGVKDAHDRYANIEVNFLLQRLETFQGITILGTNLLQNVDDGFRRRIQLLIHFEKPRPTEQVEIWNAHLPREQLDKDVDLTSIVTRFNLAGGDIFNASLSAAYAAADNNSKINHSHILESVIKEYRKKGMPVPDSVNRSVAGSKQANSA